MAAYSCQFNLPNSWFPLPVSVIIAAKHKEDILRFAL